MYAYICICVKCSISLFLWSGQATFTVPASASLSQSTQQIQLKHTSASSVWRSVNYTFEYFQQQPYVQQITLGTGSRAVQVDEDELTIVASQVL